MRVFGIVCAMDGAREAYMDVFTAVPKTRISRRARPTTDVRTFMREAG